MPATVRGAVSAGTFPVSLSTKFTETRTGMARLNEYHDGTSERSSLVTEVRRSWKLSKRLTPSDLATLRAFWEANPNTAFTFYNPFETIPPFSSTPTGSTGAYLVKFASDWEETIGMDRSDASVELIEVSANPAGAPATVDETTEYVLHGAITSSTLFIRTSHILGTPYSGGGCCSVDGLGLFSRGWMDDYSGWTLRTDSTPIAPNTIPNLSVLFAITALIRPGVSNAVPDQFLIYDCTLHVTYADGTVRIMRPTSATTAASGLDDTGTIANLQNAIDGDPSTYCLISYPAINYLNWSIALRLNNFQ